MVFGFLVMTRLFHTALQYQAIVDTQGVAILLAERQLELIRCWNAKEHGPGGSLAFSDWTGCPGVPTTSDPLYPGFVVSVSTVVKGLLSPCSQFETLYPLSERRVVSASVRHVTVKVKWGVHEHTLEALVALPTGEPHATNPVRLDPSSTDPTVNLGHSGKRTVTVSLYNSDDREIPDAFFYSGLKPEPGNTGGGDGARENARDGRTVIVNNAVYDAATPVPNIIGYGGGLCHLVGTTRYRGRLVSGNSTKFDMAP